MAPLRSCFRTRLRGQFGLLAQFFAITIAAVALGVVRLRISATDKLVLWATSGSFAIFLAARMMDKR